ncbi:general transcription factor IIH subunit TFB6 family [Aspergillus melleus]|uniref:general transcription factor IIH subunit TFB6 family n=1 Tax=Aspergillus melleus TaxID=138277 RepID=UPI001E8CC861|nr:uncharacterized protein LDX57_008830 [Aspergillus melleus]KAH8431171.1 hypothetical protein LDX57_008830 [Aspergillus melleus]
MASTSEIPSTAGGFMQPSLPSPAPSSSTATPSILPKQRSHPLRPGSTKETTVINHVDRVILTINRRHAKKFSSAYEDPTQSGSAQLERGYEGFQEVAKDIEGLVDVLWVSGTPSLQIPYLISLAVLINTYLPDYPFTPKPTFRLLRKLDTVFASLLTGEDADSGAPLSGFETRRNVVSMTEKVRIKSIAETCRVTVVEARETVDELAEDDDDSDDDELGMEMEDVYGTRGDSNSNSNADVNVYADAPGRWEMETARVYEKTIQLLGDELGKAGEFCDENMAMGDEVEGEGGCRI